MTFCTKPWDFRVLACVPATQGHTKACYAGIKTAARSGRDHCLKELAGAASSTACSRVGSKPLQTHRSDVRVCADNTAAAVAAGGHNKAADGAGAADLLVQPAARLPQAHLRLGQLPGRPLGQRRISRLRCAQPASAIIMRDIDGVVCVAEGPFKICRCRKSSSTHCPPSSQLRGFCQWPAFAAANGSSSPTSCPSLLGGSC